MKTGIVLAGGFGTRLQSVVKDVPKCMAEVAGKPFLEHLFAYLEQQSFSHIILSLGYKADIIEDWLKTSSYPFSISTVTEKEPLGTGGAIAYAFQQVDADSAYVFNGDTFFDIDTGCLSQSHEENKADISIALKPMSDFDRYGSVDLDSGQRIVNFNEKKYCSEGLINGGIYLINKGLFDRLGLSDKFSFEKDVLEAHISDLNIYGCIQNRYFIDIGIPTDFEKANIDFKNK